MTEVVIDTNVIATANGMADHAGEPCFDACVLALEDALAHRVLVDDTGLILEEYLAYGNAFTGQPGPGDQFALWLWRIQASELSVRKVTITPHELRVFEEFPEDPDLEAFDRSDRKFVAVAISAGTDPSVLNATDRDWWEYREALGRNGVSVAFLCPELMMRDG